MFHLHAEVIRARPGSGPVTMKCPHCGSTATSDVERCGSCGRSRDGVRVAAGLLTPVPYQPSERGRIDPPQQHNIDDAATRLIMPDDSTRVVVPLPDDATRLVDPDEATRFVAPSVNKPFDKGVAGAPDDVTRFAPADDATRLVVADDMTRLGAAPASTHG